MQECVHYGTQSILDHGKSVNNYYTKIINNEFDGLKIPDWFLTYKDKIKSNLLDVKVTQQYHIYHDCGKPSTKTVDSDGKIHYPNHAEVSKQLWLEADGDPLTGELIGLDMIFHTETPEDILSKHLDITIGCTLLLTALSELHANAQLFGGVDSDSFKIKFKRLEKRAKKCLYEWFEHKFMYGIVRNNISNAQRAVQLGHAVIEAGRTFLKQNDKHPSLIYCVVKSEAKLLKLSKELYDNGIKFKTFREPDMNNEITAIATEPLSYKNKNILKRYQLLI